MPPGSICLRRSPPSSPRTERQRRPALRDSRSLSECTAQRRGLRASAGLELSDRPEIDVDASLREAPTGQGCAETVVQRAAEPGVVGREEGVAAGRRADTSAPVRGDPVAGLAGGLGREVARQMRLHEVEDARKRQSKGDPSVDPLIVRLFSYETQSAVRTLTLGGPVACVPSVAAVTIRSIPPVARLQGVGTAYPPGKMWVRAEAQGFARDDLRNRQAG